MRVKMGLGCLAALLIAASPAAAQSVVGTWAASVRGGGPNDVYIVMRLTSDGRITSQTTNISSSGNRGMGYQLAGVYRFDPTRGAFTYRWTDYAPRRICMQVGCTPLPPPQPMGVVVTNRIRFTNANAFVASAPDGSTTWTRR